ncbi:MAG: hypothetical protein WBV93_10310 [Anaerobacillus sp.]
MVSCTNLEASNTDVDPDPQEVTKVETNKSIKKKLSPLYEPVVEEKAPSQPNNELFPGYKLIEVVGGELSGIQEPNDVDEWLL